MEAAHVERLTRAGCHVAIFNDSKWYAFEEFNYRTHRKILVTDGQTGFTGGVGVADHWLGHGQDKDHWRDTQVRVRGPAARLLEAAFYENFVEAGGVVVTPELNEGAPGAPTGGESLIVRSSPTGGSNDLKRLYLYMIALARRTLDITTPYFLTDESTTWALQDAVSRGVRVRILTEGDVTTGTCVQTLEGHTRWVETVVALGGGRVVSGSDDGILRVWDVDTGTCVQTLEGHNGRVLTMVALGGDRVASGSDDRTLRVWDVYIRAPSPPR